MKNLNFLKKTILLVTLSALFINCNSENNPNSEPSSEISLTTSAITNITSSSAKCGGTVVSVGNNNVIQKGVVWSTSPTPTINLTTKTYDGNGVDSYSSNIIGLDSNTKYYVRAYITTNSNTIYGNEILVNTELNDLPINLKNGLISWFPFNGTANDGSGNNNNGTLNGVNLVTDRFNKTNGSIEFKSNSNIICTTNSFNNIQTFTVSLWFKTSNSGFLFGSDNGQCDHLNLWDRYTYIKANGNVEFYVFDGAKQYCTAGGDYKDNKWHNVVSILSAAGMKIYIDGVLTAQNNAVTTAQNYIGYWRVGGLQSGGYNTLLGNIDDIGIWNRELTIAEIQQLYTMPN